MDHSLHEEFRTLVGTYFPNDVSRLEMLCIKGQEHFWGHEHVDVLAELAGVGKDNPTQNALRIPYILLSAHYFLLDAAVDGHLTDERDVLYIPHLLFLTSSLLFQTLVPSLGTTAQHNLSVIMSKRISDNALAVRLETERRQTVFVPNDSDYAIIVGRSNSTLLFYEIFCLAAGNEPDYEVLELLSDLVFYLQLGDDLGDWDEDFHRGNLTPLLQECIRAIPTDQERTLNAVGEVLLLNGIYEQYTSRLVKNLDRIENAFMRVKPLESDKIRAYIGSARIKAYSLLRDMVAAKLSYLRR